MWKCENLHYEIFKYYYHKNCLNCKFSIAGNSKELFILTEHLIFVDILTIYFRKFKLHIDKPPYWECIDCALRPNLGMQTRWITQKYFVLKHNAKISNVEEEQNYKVKEHGKGGRGKLTERLAKLPAVEDTSHHESQLDLGKGWNSQNNFIQC